MLRDRRLPPGDRRAKPSPYTIPIAISTFLLGCIISTSLVLNFAVHSTSGGINVGKGVSEQYQQSKGQNVVASSGDINVRSGALVAPGVTVYSSSSPDSPLNGVRILIAIAAYDFGQIPHLEETLDAYQDLCVTGASKVDIVVHATVPYPVTLIDLFNSRIVPVCREIFSLTIVLKTPTLRLHLVDCHRELFYRKIDDYDLFIYTEDDIRVTPRTVAAYLAETKNIQKIVGLERSADFNVGIVRYEYNYPNNVIIDDKTRHATQNVTRVYWEHGMYPVVPKAVDQVPFEELKDTHVHMSNHHQGMFLATSYLLKKWRDREGCEFDKVRDRPGMKDRPSQPSEGTQRVWMSSQMLYGGRHCNVQQVIPIDSFGTLTVLHLPNKNYRRVGHYHNRTFSDGTEKFDHGISSGLLTAMALHIELKRLIPSKPRKPYDGVKMVDEVGQQGRTPLLERRMGEYQAYVERGGVLNADDMKKIALVEER